MKMKKSVAFVCACAMALSMVSVSAFAIDYGNGGGGTVPSAPSESTAVEDSTNDAAEETPKVETVVNSNTVRDAIANGDTISVSGDSIALGRTAVNAIANADAPVTFVNEDTGVEITIDPATIETVGSINLGMDISESDLGLVIKPEMTGDFGLTLSITIPKVQIPASVDVENAHLFYVDDEGNVEDLGALSVNDDGSLTIDISHASKYVIASATIEDVSAGAGLDGTGEVID